MQKHSEILKEERLKRNMTIKEMGEFLGYKSKQAYHRYEKLDYFTKTKQKEFKEKLGIRLCEKDIVYKDIVYEDIAYKARVYKKRDNYEACLLCNYQKISIGEFKTKHEAEVAAEKFLEDKQLIECLIEEKKERKERREKMVLPKNVYITHSKTYKAIITIQDKKCYIGTYKTVREAEEACKEAKKKYKTGKKQDVK